VNSTLDNNQNMNGTYTVTVHWINENQTFVGFFETTFDLNVDTELNTPTSLGEIVIGEVLNLSIVFSSAHNSTNLDGATIEYNTSWNGTLAPFSQIGIHSNYNTTINTTGASTGSANITVYATLLDHVDQMKIIYLDLVQNTTLYYSINSTTPYYQDVVQLIIVYNDSSSNITGATIKINGTDAIPVGNYYRYNFNTTVLNATISQFVFNITANKSLYLSKQNISASLTLLATPSSVLTVIEPLKSRFYANDSADLFEFRLEYNDTRHNSIIRNATLNHNSTGNLFDITGTGKDLDADNGTWIIQVDPNEIGNFEIRFEFSKTGYQNSTYLLNLAVNITNTTLFNDNFEEWANQTIDQRFDEFDNDNVSLFLTFQDNVYYKNLSDTSLVTIENTSQLAVSNITYGNGSWLFVVNPLETGLLDLTFDFSQYGYNPIQLVITFNITATTTILLNTTLQEWTDQTIKQTFHEYDKDNVSLLFTFMDTDYSEYLKNSDVIPTFNSSFLAVSNTTFYNGSWLFTLNPLKTGITIFYFEFIQTGYQTIQLILTFNITNTPTIIENATLHEWIDQAINQSFHEYAKDNISLLFTYKDTVFNDYLNNSEVIPTYNSTFLAVSNTTYYNGSWLFTLNPLESGITIFNLEFTQMGYQTIQLSLTFNISITPSLLLYNGTSWENRTISLEQVFSEFTADQFILNFNYNDTIYNETLEASLVNKNQTNTADYEFSTILLPDNRTWEVIVNPSRAGSSTLVFGLTKAGYESFDIIIQIQISPAMISSAFVINNPQNVSFSENHTVLMTLTNANDSFSLDDVNINTNSSYLFVNNQPIGLYELNYTRALFAYQGIETIELTLSKSNFNPLTLIWTFNITEPKNPVNTSLHPSQLSYSIEWNETIIVLIDWNDTVHFINLQTIIYDENSTQDVIVLFSGISDGKHVFDIIPLNVNTAFINIKLSPSNNLTKYFQSANITIRINGLPRSTEHFTIYSENYTDPELFVYYQRNIEIGISWVDTDLDILVNNSNPTPEDMNWIQFTQWREGVYYFDATGLNMEYGPITITFSSLLYTTASLQINITVLPLKTEEITSYVTFGFYSERNISKLGYTLGLELNWSYLDLSNKSLIYQPLWEIYRNASLIDNQAIESIGMTLWTNRTIDDTWTTKIWIVFLTNHSYQRGWYNFTFNLMKYGLENKSITLDFYVKGFDLSIDLSFDEKLTRGSPYSISAAVTYSNDTIPSENTNFLSKLNELPSIHYVISLFQDFAIIGGPAEGVPVDFEISVDFRNGSSSTLRKSISTNDEGVAIYLIPKETTREIEKIGSIFASISNQTFSETGFTEYDSPVIEIVETGPDINIPLIIGTFIIAAIILIISRFMWVSRRKSKQKYMSKVATSEEQLSIISNMYNILITTSTGLPIYSVINAIYRTSKSISDLLSGLSVGIDSFLDTFQVDFLTQISGEKRTDIVEDEKPKEDEIQISAIQRKEFQILIAAAPSFRIFVFMKEVPPKAAEQVFHRIIKNLEETVQLDDLVHEEIVKPQVGLIIKKHFPIVLLNAFTIDLKRLINLDKQAKKGEATPISKFAIQALKRLILVRTGQGSLSLSPQKQIKFFDKLISKKQLTEVGVLHYDVCTNILKNTLKVPTDIISETLWKGGYADVKLFIPYNVTE
jgi:hypothetical protein